MLIYQPIGMAFLGPQVSNMMDEFVRLWLLSYYWPYWLAGNYDNLMSMGVTLNGMRPVNLCQSK